MKQETFTVQWHLTDSCNYRCKHCYQSSYTDNTITTEKATQYLVEFQKLIAELSIRKESKYRLHINFTGGEPMLIKHLPEILEEVRKIGNISFGILSNGYLPSDSILLKIKQLKPAFVQLSLEGSKQMNDSIRGKNATEELSNAVKTYHKLAIKVMISFTANSLNYMQLPDAVRIARHLKVFKIWTDRYLPISPKDELTLNPKQADEYFRLIRKLQKSNWLYPFSKTKISSERALQFLYSGGEPYKCKAGKSLLTVMPDGTVYPCRRLPIEIGNLNHESLIQIYDNQNSISDLHNTDSLSSECKSCFYKTTCAGGLRCLSYFKTGTYLSKDPDCRL